MNLNQIVFLKADGDGFELPKESFDVHPNDKVKQLASCKTHQETLDALKRIFAENTESLIVLHRNNSSYCTHANYLPGLLGVIGVRRSSPFDIHECTEEQMTAFVAKRIEENNSSTAWLFNRVKNILMVE